MLSSGIKVDPKVNFYSITKGLNSTQERNLVYFFKIRLCRKGEWPLSAREVQVQDRTNAVAVNRLGTPAWRPLGFSHESFPGTRPMNCLLESWDVSEMPLVAEFCQEIIAKYLHA